MAKIEYEFGARYHSLNPPSGGTEFLAVEFCGNRPFHRLRNHLINIFDNRLMKPLYCFFRRSWYIEYFRIKVFLIGALFCAVLSACGGSPAPAPSPVPAASPPDELNAAIRETSDYLNKQLPKGNKLVILNVQSDFPALSEYIIDELIANTVNDRVFSVVDRQQLDTIQVELDFQASGEVDDNTAQALGRMAGAQIIISGAVSRIGDLYRLRVRALSVQSAQIEGQFNRNISEGPTVSALVKSKATGYGDGGSSSTARNASPAGAPAPADPNVYRGNGHRYEVINQSIT